MDFVATYLIHYCNFVISGPNHLYPPGGVRLWGVQYKFLKKMFYFDIKAIHMAVFFS